MEAKAMTVNPEQIRLFQRVVNRKLQVLAKSDCIQVRHACIQAVHALISTDYADSSSRTAQLSFFANFLSRLMHSSDMDLIDMAAHALGLIARTDFVLSSVIVDSECDQYLEWLTRRQQDRYYCSCVGFTELAEAAPAAVTSRLKRFQRGLTTALDHPHLRCRKAVASALAMALCVGTTRGDQAPRTSQSDNLVRECERLLQSEDLGTNHRHGTLLVLLEIVGQGYDIDAVVVQGITSGCLSLCGAHHPTWLRVTAIELLCELSRCHPMAFTKYSSEAAAACISLTKPLSNHDAVSTSSASSENLSNSSQTTPRDALEVKTTAFSALAAIIESQGVCADTIAADISSAVVWALEAANPCPGAAACVVSFAKECSREDLVSEMLHHLLERAEGLPLSRSMTRLLLDLCRVRSSLQPRLQALIIERVLHCIEDDITPDGEAALGALDALAECGIDCLCGYTHKLITTVGELLGHGRPRVRREAAAACCRLVVADTDGGASNEGLMVRVLRLALADPVADVRRATLCSVRDYVVPKCNALLASDACVNYLCASLVDEVAYAREVALDVVTSIVNLNPRLVERVRLLAKQVKTELQCPTDAMQQEQAARMLGGLAKASSTALAEYSTSLNELLLERLESATSSRFKAALLATLCQLLDSGHKFEPGALNRLFNLGIDVVTGKQSVATPVAGRLLARLLRRGQTFDHSSAHAQLFTRLLECLQEGDPEVRSSMVVLLGVIGAVDLSAAMQSRQLTHPPKATAPDYDGHVATVGLLEILETPSLAFHRREAVQALQSVLKAFLSITGCRPAPLLERVLPTALNLLDSCRDGRHDPAFAEALFRTLQHAVAMTHSCNDSTSENKTVVSSFVDRIIQFMKAHWDPTEQQATTTIVSLSVELHVGLDAMEEHAEWLMPKLIEVVRRGLQDDFLAGRAVLAFEPLWSLVVPFLIPVTACLLDVAGATDQLPDLRIMCIQALAGLSKQGVSMKDVSARLVHALVRIAQGVVTPAADARHSVGSEGLRTLCVVAEALGRDFEMYRESVVKSLREITGEEAGRAMMFLAGRAGHHGEFIMPVSASRATSSLSQSSIGSGHGNGVMRRDPHVVNTTQLKAAVMGYSKAHTERDYERWLYNLTLELLTQSPRTVLRACAHVGKGHPSLARTLFPPAFSLCYNALNNEDQAVMSRCVKEVLQAGAAATSVVTNPLLALCSFVERAYAQHFADSGERLRTVHKFLPPSKLWSLAERAQNYPLALYWLELEAHRLERSAAPLQPTHWPDQTRIDYLEVSRKIVHVNKYLEQTQQAEGVLTLVKRKGVADLIAGSATYEDLGWWMRAYEEFEKQWRTAKEPERTGFVAGMMRCKEHMGDWVGVLQLANEAPQGDRCRTARAVCHAAWMLQDWETMEEAVKLMPLPGDTTPARRPGDSPAVCTAEFYRSVIAFKRGRCDESLKLVASCRVALEKEVCEHVARDSRRGYELVVMLQHLCEIEECVEYAQKSEERKPQVRKVWSKRLRAMRHDPWHMRDVLNLRKLVVRPDENIDDWLHYVSILPSKRQARTLRLLLGKAIALTSAELDASQISPSVNPHLVLSYIQVLWDIEPKGRPQLVEVLEKYLVTLKASAPPESLQDGLVMMAQWRQAMRPNDYWTTPHRNTILELLRAAMAVKVRRPQAKEADYRIWHEWALLNLRIAHRDGGLERNESGAFALSAVKGFVRCIEISDPPELATQDVLRLLNLMLNFGNIHAVETEFRVSLKTLPPRFFVPVLPQVLSRIGGKDPTLEKIVHDLLLIIAKHCPQRVLLSLSVPLKCPVVDSTTRARKAAAAAVYSVIRDKQPRLASEVELLTHELVRVAVTWHEKWCESLMEANRQWMQGHGDAVINILAPLHSEVANPTSEMEEEFLKTHTKELASAKNAWTSWRSTRREADMTRAWEIYGHIYGRLSRYLQQQKQVFLKSASPPLYNARNMSVTVPGTEGSIHISRFKPRLHVMGSKRRPKQLSLCGIDGEEYMFLLKGHEDLRLDQRVMQLLELVNNLITINSPKVSIQSMMPVIQTFAVVPLSSTAGLIGWVERAQTMDDIISEMRGRNSKRVREELEMFKAEQHGLHGTLRGIQKAEALEVTLQKLQSEDLHTYLWLRSADAAQWIERRAEFTRSSALMSMVGYILGLGDRHPGNIMIGYTGKVVHIDFADCFETAMTRESFPEKVPFRLSPMMVRAMGIGGLTGTFRLTARVAMRMLRKGKQPLMAMLEAFVHDPIVHSKLNVQSKSQPAAGPECDDETPARSLSSTNVYGSQLSLDGADDTRPVSSSRLIQSYADPDDLITADANSVAKVIRRIQSKLDGTEFLRSDMLRAATTTKKLALDEAAQVEVLMRSAQSIENLAQCYAGWCPFW